MDNLPENKSNCNAGGGLPVIQYWIEKTLSPQGLQLWQTLNHKSACLSCAWGTGGQKGGFVNEAGEYLQRCAKSVEAIAAELQPGIKQDFFQKYNISELQQLTSQECDDLGRLSYPLILKSGSSHYQRISWEEVYQIATIAFQQLPEKIYHQYLNNLQSNIQEQLIGAINSLTVISFRADCTIIIFFAD